MGIWRITKPRYIDGTYINASAVNPTDIELHDHVIPDHGLHPVDASAKAAKKSWLAEQEPGSGPTGEVRPNLKGATVARVAQAELAHPSSLAPSDLFKGEVTAEGGAIPADIDETKKVDELAKKSHEDSKKGDDSSHSKKTKHV